jgi:4-hydroxybenzoate polyprenyltransferase
MKYIQLIRVHQWVKNLFVFVPIFFAGQLHDLDKLKINVISFFCFSFIAGCVYIINDYLDKEKDKKHPEKMNRPLASGAVSTIEAVMVFSMLLGTAIFLLSYLNIFSWLTIGIYLLMNIAYSIRLKHTAIIDITIISFGFLLRIMLGGLSADIPVSQWLVIIIFLLSMTLALGKRRGEFLRELDHKQVRKSLAGYNQVFIDQAIVVMVAVTIVSYIMYCISPEVENRIQSKYVYVSTLFVILGLMRYLQQTLVFNRTESPTSFLYKDRFLQAVLVMWVGYFGMLIYMKQMI